MKINLQEDYQKYPLAFKKKKINLLVFLLSSSISLNTNKFLKRLAALLYKIMLRICYGVHCHLCTDAHSTYLLLSRRLFFLIVEPENESICSLVEKKVVLCS